MPGKRTRAPRAKRRSRAYRAGRPTMMFTYEPEALKRLIEATPSGMAYWANTGPPGTVCEQCSFFGYATQYPYSCYRYFEVFRDHGPPLPVGTPSCEHFRPRSL